MADAVKKSWIARHPVITVLGGLVVAGVLINMMGGGTPTPSSSTTPSPAPAAAPEEAKKVTAEDLYAAYKANEIAADAEYKGKLVEVTGEVTTIGTDILKDPYISMKGSNDFETVQCMLKKEAAADAAAVKKGSTITLRGRVEGYLLNVIVRQCEFVK